MPEPDNLNENVETLASLRARAEQGVSRHQRFIERFTSELGRPRSFYSIVALVVGWVIYNTLGATLAGSRAFDPPPFGLLQSVISFSALLLAITILTTQSRQTRDFEQRAQLELQVNLLAEQKIAKLIALMEELRRDLPSVKNRVDPVAEVMKEPMDPHAVLSALEQTFDDDPKDSVNVPSDRGLRAHR